MTRFVPLSEKATTVRAELFDYMTDGWVAMDDVSLTGPTVTKYYYLGSQRVAMRQGCVLTYLHSDHLGSASLATNASGMKVSEQRSPVFQAHLPYGGTRSGSMPMSGQSPPTVAWGGVFAVEGKKTCPAPGA